MVGNGNVPTAAYPQIVTARCDMYEAWVESKFVDSLGGAICGMIVDCNYVELEIALLRQCRTDGIAYGAYPVAHGDYH